MTNFIRERRYLERCSVYPSDAVAPGDVPWPVFVRLARAERTAAVVYHNWLRDREPPPVPPWVMEEFRELATSITARNVLRFDQSRSLLEALHRGAIPAIPLKGIFLARFIYPDPGMRDMSDIDLLIRKEDLQEADRILSQLRYAPLSNRRTDHGPHASCYLNSMPYRSDDPMHPAVIHLHWHLVNASVPLFMYHDAIDLASVFAEARPIDWDGVPALAMAPHHLVVYLCEHAMKHSFEQLIFLTDVAQVIHACPSLDWDRVLDTAREWRLSRVLRYALGCLSGPMGVSIPREVVRSLGAQNIGLDGRFVETSLRRHRRWMGLSILGYLSLLDRVRDKLRFLVRFLVPPGGEMERFGKKPVVSSYLHRTGRAVIATLKRATL